MTVIGIWTHQACFGHDPGFGHPESPARLKAVLAALDAPAFAALPRFDAPLAADADIQLIHDRAYLEKLKEAFAERREVYMDNDTVLSLGSEEAVYRAAGAAVDATKAVMAGKVTRAFCAVRPPGHHAEQDHAMGFCIFNNVAIAAAHALKHLGLARVAIVDFDVHHGNGTQHYAETDARVLFASTHQYPFYPGTGDAAQKGFHSNVVNVPLAAGSPPATFRAAYKDVILPALEAFVPELLFISAGFDAHRDDPLAALRLTEADYSWVTQELAMLAQKHAQGRIVSMLEGGYNLEALGASVAAHVRALSLAGIGGFQ